MCAHGESEMYLVVVVTSASVWWDTGKERKQMLLVPKGSLWKTKVYRSLVKDKYKSLIMRFESPSEKNTIFGIMCCLQIETRGKFCAQTNYREVQRNGTVTKGFSVLVLMSTGNIWARNIDRASDSEKTDRSALVHRSGQELWQVLASLNWKNVNQYTGDWQLL